MRPTSAIMLIIGVVASIVIAWIVVDLALHLVFVLLKVGIVVVVAALVFVLLWSLVRRAGSRR
jgi:high-affinity Fe2+/Pb2+ permease